MTLTSSNYKNIKILIAEDLPSDALLNEREARKTFQDVSLKIVDSEKEFIKALNEFKPDIVLSDYNMPGFNGLEALKITEAMSPSTPVIIVTGSVNEETAVECMRAGANNYVLKEQLRRLGPALQHALEEKQTKEAHLKAQQDLIESEQRYRLLFDLSPIGVILQNENGFIINVLST
ncbi:MAG: response regulator [Sphingobacteriia bacterium]|nr:response regulator [Sphingobacteriia bacterium]